MDAPPHEAEGPVKLLIAEERADVRRGLRELLATYEGVRVLGAVHSAEEAVALIEELEPDVVLLSCHMAVVPTYPVVHEIKRRRPRTRVVVLGMTGCLESVARAAGADAFLVKGCSTEQLLGAVCSSAATDR